MGEKFALTPDSVWQLGKLASTSFSVTDPTIPMVSPQIQLSQWPPLTQFVSQQMEREMRQRLLLHQQSRAAAAKLTRSKPSHALGVNLLSLERM